MSAHLSGESTPSLRRVAGASSTESSALMACAAQEPVSPGLLLHALLPLTADSILEWLHR